jgi:hypothetical protein
MLLSALAVAFTAGALLGVAESAHWGGADAGGGTSVQADWSWGDSVPADLAGSDVKAGKPA